MNTPPWTWQRWPAAQLIHDRSLRTAWDALNDGHLALPILTSNVIASALSCFGDGNEVLLQGRNQRGDVQTMVVLTKSHHLGWSTFQPSQLPLGACVATACVQARDLCESLMHANAIGHPLVMSITQVDPLAMARPSLSTDGSAAKRTGWMREDDYIPTSWIDVHGTFDEYWAQRGKNLRQNLRKQRNKLAADGTRVSWHMHTSATDVASALERYGALETQGWKASGGTAIAANNVQGRFYRTILESAAEDGGAWISEYRFDDRTVAMNLGVVRRGVLVVLKTAYDETIPKTLSPASLLREDELKHLFSSGEIKRLEFYGRTMEWHTKLTEQQRTLYHLTHYRYAWLGRWLSDRRERLVQSAAVTTASETHDPQVKKGDEAS